MTTPSAALNIDFFFSAAASSFSITALPVSWILVDLLLLSCVLKLPTLALTNISSMPGIFSSCLPRDPNSEHKRMGHRQQRMSNHLSSLWLKFPCPSTFLYLRQSLGPSSRSLSAWFSLRFHAGKHRVLEERISLLQLLKQS